MANRVFVSTVVLVWLTSMSWLVTERILPSFYQGQPPDVYALEMREPVAWEVEWGNKVVGTAASVRVPGIGGTAEVHNRLKLTNVPLLQLAPTWMRTAVGNLGSMSLDVITRIEFDSLGSFSAFESRLSLNDLPSVLRISGRIEDSSLELKVRSGELPYKASIYLPDRRVLNETLFPDARIPYLKVGRRWQEEVLSPFRAPGDTVELVQVEVISEETIEFAGEIERVLCLEYRGLPGSGITQNARLQAVAWVNHAGEVLRRDVYLGDSKLRFNRLLGDSAESAGERLFEYLGAAWDSEE